VSRTALYRHFDAAGALLYVGISLNTLQRTAQHKHGAKWFERIARITIDWHATRSAALAAEAIAIARESPECNLARPKQSAPTPQRVRLQRPHFGVAHSSGRVDGWYRDRANTEHMLGWFRAVFPRDSFRLIEIAAHNCYPIGDQHLKTTGSERWAATPPDYAAGDAHDRATA
jgi:hypothetical protein